MKIRELKLEFSKKRLILFIIVILIAIFSIIIGVINLLKDKGNEWSTIEITKIKDSQGNNITPFYGEVLLDYYLEGNKDDRHQILKEVSHHFNYVLSECFILLDADHGYKNNDEDIKNLFYINNHPNKEIEVHPFLYKSLKDAYKYMIESDGKYNLFAGELYYYWVRVLELGYADPLDNPLELNIILSRLDDYKNGKYDLIFNDDNNGVTFYVEKNYDIELIEINLQFLGQAYVIDEIKDYLISMGQSKGMVYSTYYSFFATLGENPTPKSGGFYSTKFYHPDATADLDFLSEIFISQPFSGCRISDYHVLYRYKVKSSEKINGYDVIRHPFYNASNGLPLNEYRLVSVLSFDRLIDNVKKAFLLFNLDKEEQNDFIIGNSNDFTYYLIIENQSENKVYSDDLSIRASISLKEYGQYVINKEFDVKHDYIS